MARTSSVTQEQVNLAAAELLAAGKTPGTRNVRELLGTGSNQTIQALLANWQQAQPGPSAPEAVEVPQSLLHAIQTVLGDTKRATAEEYQQAIALANSQRDRAAQDALTQYTEFERQLKLSAELSEENISLRSSNTELQRQVEALNEVDKARQAAEKQVAALMAQVSQLESRLAEQATTAKTTAQAHDFAMQNLAEKHAAAMEEQSKRYEQAVQTQKAQTEKQLQRLRDLVASNEAALAGQAATVQALEKQLASERAEVQRLRDLVASNEATQAGQAATVQALEKQLATNQEKLRQGESQKANAEQRAAAAEAQVKTLKAFEALAEGLQQRISALETQSPSQEKTAAQKLEKR